MSFQLNPYAIPYLIASALMLFLGVYIFIHGGRTAQKRAFLNICATFFLWLFGTFLVYSVDEPFMPFLYVTYAGGCFISVGLFYYAAVWLERVRQERPWIILGFTAGFVFLGLVIATDWVVYEAGRFFWGYHSRLSPVGGGLFLLFFFSYLFLFFRTLYYGYKAETNLVKKRQIRLVGLAFLIATIGCSDLMPSYFGVAIFPLGGLVMFGAVLTLAYTIIRYKLLDIETVIHKTLMWFCTTLVAVSPFAVLVHYSQDRLRSQSPEVFTAFYLALALAFYFYFRAVKPPLDIFFQRRMANLRALSSRFSAELVHLRGLRDLLQSTARMLRRALFVRNISIYLKTGEGGELSPAIVKRMRGLKAFPLDHPFLAWLEKENRVVVAELAESNPGWAAVKPALQDFAAKTGACVIVPLVLGGKLIGTLNLGRKENLKKYRADEIRFLSELKAPLTIAFSNSLQVIAMQENLRKWNEELERKVEERTRQLQETQTQLIQAEKLATIGTLAGGVAHEINNPLTAVLTNAQILKMSGRPEDMESLSLIEEGAMRCRNIIHKLLKYARKPAGGAAALEKVDVNTVVERAIGFLGYQLEQENITLKVAKALDLPAVEGNANELEQVLTNLILNAKDAIKSAGREGLIQIHTSKNHETIEIKVIDNGTGIPRENLPKVFDPFFTTKEVGKGTGLGLAVSYGIVQKHQGRIDVESRPGQTLFTVHIPFAPASQTV